MADDLLLDEEYVTKLVNSSARYYLTHLLEIKGKKRKVHKPLPDICLLQYWVIENILSQAPTPARCATAYEKGSCILANAAVHKDNSHIMQLDIKHFFDSITSDMVFDYYIGLDARLSDADARALQRISTYRGTLTVGSPISPFLANRIMIPVDIEIQECLPSGITYTRYSDDMCFSSPEFIEPQLIDAIQEVLSRYSLRLNTAKTHFSGRGDRQKVTGVVLIAGGKLSLGSMRKSALKKMLYEFVRYGKGNPSKILGHINFCKSIDPESVESILMKYSTRGPAVELLKAAIARSESERISEG
ncbi:MAG: RNA-directed DNA polymerase [Actinobacteria bacterium]|nr:RNA-directed DNA polymerase [Actinomycetota bacterium]